MSVRYGSLFYPEMDDLITLHKNLSRVVLIMCKWEKKSFFFFVRGSVLLCLQISSSNKPLMSLMAAATGPPSTHTHTVPPTLSFHL